MERKVERIGLINYSLLAPYFAYEWKEAKACKYVTDDYADLEKQEIDDERDLFQSNAVLIKAKLERILKCDHSQQGNL